MATLGKKTRKGDKGSKLPGPNFVAPDGGWGWMVVLASGLFTLCVLPPLQLFGLIFRDRFEQLAITNSEMTTIINVNIALTSCVGLANGPMFRRFNYRPIAICGSILIICGLLLASIANNFITYILSFSILYGAGIGICVSANSLALNTYFNKRRRNAVSLSWTIAAVGPIVAPYLVTWLLPEYGIQGTMLLASGLAMHALVAGLILQPAQKYSKHIIEEQLEKNEILIDHSKAYTNECNTPLASRASRSAFSSQYFLNEYFSETATPMMSRANDGWYSSEKRSLASSKLSLTSKKYYANDIDSKTPNQDLSKKTSYTSLGETYNKTRKASISNFSETRSRRSSFSLMAPDSILKRQKSYSGTSATIDEDLLPENQIDNNKNGVETRSIKSSITIVTPESKPRKQKRQSVTIKIEESEIEDCPSNKAPQDLLENERSNLLQIEKDETTRISLENNFNKNNNNYEYKNNLIGNNFKSPNDLKPNKSFNIENDILIEASKKLEIYAANCKANSKEIEERLQENEDDFENDDVEKHTLWQKITIFFDLELLKDFTYVNLMLGMNLANFAEINFSILTPFILADFGLEKEQIALVMSLLGGMDILVRFLIPFASQYISWENKSFFLFGVFGMAIGRLVIIYFHSYPVILCACAWIGLNKALRTVFMALVIASHVPLQRLPAATGIQLLCAGLLYPTIGPVVGWIRDSTDYKTTLHCLNVLTYITIISWSCESIYRKRSLSKK